MRELIPIITFTIINILLISVYSLKPALVFTKYGAIRGTTSYSRWGRLYESYRGIPYAKPPVNSLRFKAPEPPEQWTPPLDATEEGPICIQKNYFFANPQVEGQEDCLYLNIYTPMISIQKSARAPLPVMVFIHWGGFFAGRGTSDYLSPEYFMDKDIVMVTFNYRLGIFGFLTTLDDAAPGNYALKDQRAALRWVQENIENFGGDKNRVTIFGQSSGAGSVHLHLLSPFSKGLFQRAISHSGSALALWATPMNPVQSTVLAAQANFVNCSDYIGDSYKIIDCLRKVPANTLVATQDLFKTFAVDPLTVYTVVTEIQTSVNPEPFITKHPIEYIQAQEFLNVPWINGFVEDEGTFKAGAILRQSLVLEQLNKNFDTILPGLMYFSSSTNDVQSLHNNVIKQYLQNTHYVNVSNLESIQGFIDLYSDRAFLYPAYQSSLLHGAKGHKPIWIYNFNYKGEHSYADMFAATNETINFNWGVSHCDDLLYLFKSPGLMPPLKQQTDVIMSYMMINLWTNFATYGDPNPPENKVLQVTWNPLNINGDDDMKNENFCFLNISGFYNNIQFRTQCGFREERMKFWSNQDLFENFQGLR